MAAHGGGGGGWGVGRGGEKGPPLSPKIFHKYPTTMKRGSYTLPKKDPKNIQIK